MAYFKKPFSAHQNDRAHQSASEQRYGEIVIQVPVAEDEGYGVRNSCANRSGDVDLQRQPSQA